MSRLKRVRTCGRAAVTGDGSVAVRVTEGEGGRRIGGFAGVASCGSVWACPVCSRKIAASRQADLQAACEWWEKIGGALALGTFTVSHRSHQSLKQVWSAVSTGWGKATSGRAWQKNQATFGVEGWHRVVEVNYGENGWHVHVHVVLFLHHGLSPAEREALTSSMHQRWNKGLAKHGYSSSRERGADIRLAHGADAAKVLADYFTKGQYTADGTAAAEVALEVHGGTFKRGKRGSRTPFAILADFIDQGDVADLDVWHEWELSSKGRRQTAWSKGFRQLVGLGVELTDEELAEQELSSSKDDVVILTAESWAVVRAFGSLVLDMAETLSTPMFRHWLTNIGVDWRLPT